MITRHTTPTIATGSAAVLLAAAFLGPTASPLGAETLRPAADVPAATVHANAAIGTDLARALELEARAWGLRNQMNRRGQASRLLREAAELRPADDPVRVSNLREASRMSFHAGNLGQAATDAGDAARAALRQGDVLQAAHAYLDAAWMAVEAGDPARALASAEEAMILTASPLLSDEDREGIMGRVTAGA
jgi:hypothetical protein